jgi:hypothetical protein
MGPKIIDLEEVLRKEAEAVAAVLEEKKQAAADFLKDTLGDHNIKMFRDWIELNGLDWPRTFAGWHFHGGMAIRNHLREGGFGENELGIENLDYIYVQLIERAVLGKEMERKL